MTYANSICAASCPICLLCLCFSYSAGLVGHQEGWISGDKANIKMELTSDRDKDIW